MFVPADCDTLIGGSDVICGDVVNDVNGKVFSGD